MTSPPDVPSHQHLSEWLFLRTALWSLADRSLALHAVQQFLTTSDPSSARGPAVSPDRVDPVIKDLDAFCAGRSVGRQRCRPEPVADLPERQRAHVWLAENHSLTLRLVARGVFRQFRDRGSDLGSLHPDDCVNTFLFATTDGLATVLESYDPLAAPLLQFVAFCFKRASRRQVLRDPSIVEIVDFETERRLFPDPSPSQEARAAQRQLARLVWQEVEHLPGEMQRVFSLFYADERSSGEIADEIGKSSDAVKMLLHRARTAVRTRLKDRGLL